ncbi:dTDP-4-dehydrorhamnose 3,5-epimerase [bacterium HR41]|nr:dTDP-4-dehydrorhamnose 3,5-epimerase [bacterium HR41]
MERSEAPLERGGARQREHATVERAEPSAARDDHAVAAVLGARIDADHDHCRWILRARSDAFARRLAPAKPSPARLALAAVIEILPTRLPGLKLIQPRVFGDERGFFHETYRRDAYTAAGIDCEFVQDNHSRSRRGVVRGMHFALPPGQAKLVRCAHGKIVDIVVDIRRGSPTYGQWEAFELDDENLRQLFVPVGFAHGFCV